MPPIWVKDRHGKFKVFVYPQLLEQYHDGRWGFFYARVMGQGEQNPYWIMFNQYRYNFDWDAKTEFAFLVSAKEFFK